MLQVIRLFLAWEISRYFLTGLKEHTVWLRFTAFLSIEEHKATLDEASSRNEHYLKTGHLHIEKECLSRAKWFKGSKDRGFRGNLAAQKG